MATTELKTTEDKAKAEEKSKVESAAAASGAQAVADAVKQVADAAVVAAAKVPAQKAHFDFAITGRPGGTFIIRSNVPNLSSSGSVLVGGKAQTTFEWGADYIRGALDADARSGEVIVQIDPQTRRTGYLKVD